MQKTAKKNLPRPGLEPGSSDFGNLAVHPWSWGAGPERTPSLSFLLSVGVLGTPPTEMGNMESGILGVISSRPQGAAEVKGAGAETASTTRR